MIWLQTVGMNVDDQVRFFSGDDVASRFTPNNAWKAWRDSRPHQWYAISRALSRIRELP